MTTRPEGAQDDPIFETIPSREPSRTTDTLWWAVIGVGACASAVGLALILVSCSGSLTVGDDDVAGHAVAVGAVDVAVGDADDAVGDDDDAVGDDDDTSGPQDLDGDGYTEADGDCDDGDDTIHPGAEELCDEVDHNCDGDIHGDNDGDGSDVCDDCDDADDTVHPGALETNGDGVDSNCDGLDDLVPGENCYGDDNTISVPGWVEFTISWNDESNGPAGADHYFDDVEFIGVAGTTVHIGMWEREWGLDAYLYLLDPACQIVAEDDNGADPQDDDAYLEYEITSHGIYTIVATSANPWEDGSYELEIW